MSGVRIRWDASWENDSSPFPYMEAGTSGGKEGLRVAFRPEGTGGQGLLEMGVCTLTTLSMPGTHLGTGHEVFHWNFTVLGVSG